MGMTGLCLGKLPARPNAVKLKLSTYIDFSALPPIPTDFGHEENMPVRWGMLGNDQYGDCVVAGGAHEHMIWNHMAGKNLTFNVNDVLADFQAITGKPPSPDTGADMQQAASYRLRTGLMGADGQRHRIGAYLELKPGDLKHLYAAMYLFGAVGIGIQFPDTAFDQFNKRQAWHIVSGSKIEAGHYIPGVALRSNIVSITWGRFQAMRPSFYAAYNDESICYLSKEMLLNGKSPEAFDYQALLADLHNLRG